LSATLTPENTILNETRREEKNEERIAKMRIERGGEKIREKMSREKREKKKRDNMT
jgi:hypothetical protein